VILHEAAGYLAVNKPSGVLVIPGRSEGDTVVLKTQLEAQLKKRLWVVHRLDRDTSGVLLFALTEPAHRTLSMAFEAGEIEKKYTALVEGRLDKPLDLDVALMPARRGRMRVAQPGHDSKNARTLIEPRRVFARTSMVEATPLTGRTHQIRVHLQSAGHPLVFDHQYGNREPIRDGERVLLERTPLHATRLTIPKLENIAPVTIEAPLPEDLRAVIALWEREG
jgi:tRNA pseudouridine32 synthase/23S rRNA pseudouridine746 synthase/23S rRNA pseudouridine955/2504/2580 synthase